MYILRSEEHCPGLTIYFCCDIPLNKLKYSWLDVTLKVLHHLNWSFSTVFFFFFPDLRPQMVNYIRYRFDKLGY